MSMAAKLRDLVDEISGANLQMEGHVDVLTQSAKDLQEPEALDGYPPTCHLGPQLGGCCPVTPNMKYCLEICVTLMEELGAIPQPCHSWMPPL